MNVYWTNIEYKYLESSVSYGKFKGGYVFSFVKAKDAREALKKFVAELESLNLNILNVDFIAIYEDIPWESTEDQKKYDKLASTANETNTVVCDNFCSYEND